MNPNGTSALLQDAPKKTAKSIEERPQNAHYSDIQRLQALALYEAGIPAATAAARAGIVRVILIPCLLFQSVFWATNNVPEGEDPPLVPSTCLRS